MRSVIAAILCAIALRAEVMYRVRLSASEGGAVVELSSERYVAAVLAGEAGTLQNMEGLKALAVAARTYAAYTRPRHRADGFDFCATTHCQRAILKDASGRFLKAAEATHGELLWFHSKPAFAVYTQDCGGESESGEAVWPSLDAPYLKVHADPYCISRRGSSWSWTIAAGELRGALANVGMKTPATLQRVVATERTPSGRVQTLSLEGDGQSNLISATSFRFAVGRTLGWNKLRSDQYRIDIRDGVIRFDGTGMGHGVGLCQNGAEAMAERGATYREILDFYYPGTTVSLLANDVNWTSAPASHGTVFAVQNSVATQVAALVDREATELLSQYDLTLPGNLALYVYPDMDAYRNATGEPGWVGGHTTGSRIETQPFKTLQHHGGFPPVLRHELLHAMVENCAKPGLPLWFREGLVEDLAGGSADLSAATRRQATLDDGVRGRSDPESAREAHEAAAARVAILRSRYGVGELLRWVREGIPEQVTRSVTSSRPENSK